MWRAQDIFREKVQTAAQSLFMLLDERFNPTVSLLGVLTKSDSDQQIICLETEEADFNSDDFQSVPSLAEQLKGSSIKSHQPVSKAFNRAASPNEIAAEAYQNAVRIIIDSKRNFRNKESYVSKPIRVHGYQILIILELEKKPFENYTFLTKTHIDAGYSISRSLIESTVKLFLQRCAASLQQSDSGSDLVTDVASNKEILRQAGERFMNTISWVDNDINKRGLFESLNIISSLWYEGDASVGQIIIAAPSHPNVILQVRLVEAVSISEYRKIRKLLQTVDDSPSIISDGQQIFGLGSLTGEYNPKSESLFTIQFVDHYHWLVTHNDQPLMRCKYGLPGLVREGVDFTTFNELCNRFFGSDENQSNRLFEVVKAATRQKHGALVVVTTNAEAEAERLKYQSFLIDPIQLTAQNVRSFTSIDGAIVVDPNGICHALGVILDGPATPKGDASRGSRYNSAVRYVEFRSLTHPCLVIVVSEDGMVDLIPLLKSRIHRSDIDEHLAKLISLSQHANFEIIRFFKVHEFFEHHAFYLSDQDCLIINEVRRVVQENLWRDGTAITMRRQDFSPDPEMNNTYYL